MWKSANLGSDDGLGGFGSSCELIVDRGCNSKATTTERQLTQSLLVGIRTEAMWLIHLARFVHEPFGQM